MSRAAAINAAKRAIKDEQLFLSVVKSRNLCVRKLFKAPQQYNWKKNCGKAAKKLSGKRPCLKYWSVPQVSKKPKGYQPSPAAILYFTLKNSVCQYIFVAVY